jgi:hypothetical protein
MQNRLQHPDRLSHGRLGEINEFQLIDFGSQENHVFFWLRMQKARIDFCIKLLGERKAVPETAVADTRGVVVQ